MTGQKVVLSDEDLAIIKRIQFGKYPTGEDQFKVLYLFILKKVLIKNVYIHIFYLFLPFYSIKHYSLGNSLGKKVFQV